VRRVGIDARDHTKERAISTQTLTTPIAPEEIEHLAQVHLDGLASEADVAVLEARRDEWVAALQTLRNTVQATIDRVARDVTGPERPLVLSDFNDEYQRIDDMLAELTGEVGIPQLQLSWTRGRIVAWAAGQDADPEPSEDILERLGDAGAATAIWEPHDRLKLPTGARADAVSAPIQTTLGWLVALGASAGEDEELGASVTWMGLAAALAVRLVARGRMVPQLRKVGDAAANRSYFAVRWEPALIDSDELSDLAQAMPGAVAVLQRQRDPRAVTQAVVAGFVDAICRDAAGRLAVPSPPPQPRTASDVAETVLGRLDGSEFEAPHQQGTEVSKSLKSWADDVIGVSRLTLIVQLDPPDDGDAWHLRTLTSDGRRQEELVEAAMSRANHDRKEALKQELERIENLYEPLMRARNRRRGQVILSQDEAWDLMTAAGPMLAAAGFDVRVPPLSRKKATPQLRVTSVGPQETVVGAQQLTSVRWSAVFDDVELSADDIMRLAKESRPLVRSHGRWIEVDHADLDAAAAALAERADRTRLTGAEMLRYALGLDGSALGRAVSVAGEGWAADLLRSARQIPEHPPTKLQGFAGELRSYQADALAWLEFLDSAGLGGCLALDMGLGKTPTVLAHLHQTSADGPALVVAPSAVVGNWAAEAARFVPGLRVVIHHGADRANAAQIADEVASADVLITTYGTAVRDIDALADVRWGTVVLDEGQVIKNPASVTAQQLRRLEAHTRMVLTGTPIENGLGDMWALMDFTNPGLVGDRATFVAQMQRITNGGAPAESALRALNGVLVFRRTKAEPDIAAELPDRIDKLDHCPMTAEQIGLYQAVLDDLVVQTTGDDSTNRKGKVLAAITALKQICNHPDAYTGDDGSLDGRSGKLARLEEIVDDVFEAGERVLIFTHFARWGEKLAAHLTAKTGLPVACYHGGLTRGARDNMVREFQEGKGAGALVVSLKAGGTGLNLTAASHVVLYDRWWNPAVEDQARDRVWRIGQTKTVLAHRLVCPGTVDERVEEVVAGKRRIADLALPKSSSVGDLDSDQLRRALGLDPDALLTDEYAELVGAQGGAV
jgi:superfamily II DNA or RNA helicase